jgi:hypothetical protein
MSYQCRYFSLSHTLEDKHNIYFSTFIVRGHAKVQWLRHCATNRKVAGSILDGITGFLH